MQNLEPQAHYGKSPSAPVGGNGRNSVELAELEAIYQTAQVGLCVLDLDLRYLRINRRLAEINGLPVEEHLGRTVHEVLPEIGDAIERTARRIFETGQPLLNHEIRGCTPACPDEERIWIEHWSPLQDAHGRVTALNVVVQDVTEQRRTERELVSTNERLEQRVAERTSELRGLSQTLKRQLDFDELLLDTLRTIVLVLDEQGLVVRVNRHFTEVTGYEPDEVIGCDWFETFLPERERGRILDLFHESLAGHAVRGNVNPVVTRDGRERIVEWFAALLTAEGSRLLLCAGHDVTERVEAERALYESEQRLKSIVETAADAIVTIDRQGIVQSFNPAAERMFGYCADEVVGRNVRLLMPAPYRDEHDAHLERYAGTTGTTHAVGRLRELVAVRSSGTVFPIDLVISEIDGLGLFTGIIRDATERKALQQAVLTIADDEQRAIGQELHDGVCQELLGLSMTADTLATELHDRELAELASLADGLCTRIGESLQSLRNLSRGLVPFQVDAEGLPSALEELARRNDGAGGVRCSFENTAPAHCASQEAATQLYRIVQEAVSNAVRHAQATEVRISSLREADGTLVLQVADDGTGIRDVQPAGIGLRTMRHRAELLGGTLTVSRAHPHGTVVCCRVPQHGLDGFHG